MDRRLALLTLSLLAIPGAVAQAQTYGNGALPAYGIRDRVPAWDPPSPRMRPEAARATARHGLPVALPPSFFADAGGVGAPAQTETYVFYGQVYSRRSAFQSPGLTAHRVQVRIDGCPSCGR